MARTDTPPEATSGRSCLSVLASDRWLHRPRRIDFRKQAARAYLSRQHRDMDEHCCPLPAILSELPTQPQAFRASLETHLTSLLKAMVAGEPDRDAARQTALADLAMMIGALSLARALGPTPFSDELLAASKAAIR